MINPSFHSLINQLIHPLIKPSILPLIKPLILPPSPIHASLNKHTTDTPRSRSTLSPRPQRLGSSSRTCRPPPRSPPSTCRPSLAPTSSSGSAPGTATTFRCSVALLFRSWRNLGSSFAVFCRITFSVFSAPAPALSMRCSATDSASSFAFSSGVFSTALCLPRTSPSRLLRRRGKTVLRAPQLQLPLALVLRRRDAKDTPPPPPSRVAAARSRAVAAPPPAPPSSPASPSRARCAPSPAAASSRAPRRPSPGGSARSDDASPPGAPRTTSAAAAPPGGTRCRRRRRREGALARCSRADRRCTSPARRCRATCTLAESGGHQEGAIIRVPRWRGRSPS